MQTLLFNKIFHQKKVECYACAPSFCTTRFFLLQGSAQRISHINLVFISIMFAILGALVTNG